MEQLVPCKGIRQCGPEGTGGWSSIQMYLKLCLVPACDYWKGVTWHIGCAMVSSQTTRFSPKHKHGLYWFSLILQREESSMMPWKAFLTAGRHLIFSWLRPGIALVAEWNERVELRFRRFKCQVLSCLKCLFYVLTMLRCWGTWASAWLRGGKNHSLKGCFNRASFWATLSSLTRDQMLEYTPRQMKGWRECSVVWVGWTAEMSGKLQIPGPKAWDLRRMLLWDFASFFARHCDGLKVKTPGLTTRGKETPTVQMDPMDTGKKPKLQMPMAGGPKTTVGGLMTRALAAGGPARCLKDSVLTLEV